MIENSEIYFSRLERLENMVKLSSKLVKILETEIAIFKGDVERSPTPIDKLMANTKSMNILFNHDIKYVEQLIKLRASDILSIKGAGLGTLHDISKALEEFGLTLSEDTQEER